MVAGGDFSAASTTKRKNRDCRSALRNRGEFAVSRAAEKGIGPVVVVVDALDEAEVPTSGVNRLCLPRLLPPGSYVVATIRKNLDPFLDVEQRSDDILFDKDSVENQRDVRAYVDSYVQNHWDAMQNRLAEWKASRQDFVEIVSRQSDGNFMYLHYILPDIRNGRICSLQSTMQFVTMASPRNSRKHRRGVL